MTVKNPLSRCYWDTSNLGTLWDNNGRPVQTAVDVLSRPYPIAVAGKNLKFSFDPEKSQFDMEFDGHIILFIC